MDNRVIAELVVHLVRIASGQGLAERLTPVQWSVLRYLARANRFSRTPSAFASFHGTTRGTASQTIKSLESLGYLERARSKADGRSAHLALTDKARAMLADDPFETLVRAIEALSPSARGHFAKALGRMIGQVAQERKKDTFGTCMSCRHLEGDKGQSKEQASYICGCVGEPLEFEELAELFSNGLVQRNSYEERRKSRALIVIPFSFAVLFSSWHISC